MALDTLTLIAEQTAANNLLVAGNATQRGLNSAAIQDQVLAAKLIQGPGGDIIDGLGLDAFAVRTQRLNDQPAVKS